MAQLSSLPNEILGHILSYVMPEDLEHFAQTSKHIRSVSGPALQDHRQLIRKYERFAGPGVPQTVEPLLLEVLANLRIGRYVKEVYLGHVFEQPKEQDKDTQETEVGKLGLRQIHDAVDGCKLFDPQELDRIHKLVNDGWRSVLITLVLPLLPNLTVLSMTGRGCLEHNTMLEQTLQLDAQLLSKLRHIIIKNCRFAPDSLEGFLWLPSLRKVSCWRAIYMEWRRTLYQPLPISNVTDLEFRNCPIILPLLGHFLELFPHLQSFVYVKISGEFREYEGFNALIVRAALQERVSKTLRRLVLLTNARPILPIGSFCEFQVLENVYCEEGCLTPMESAKGNNGEYLSLMLPKSLKVLTIKVDTGFYKPGRGKFIDHAIQAKTDPAMPLPLWETLCFKMTREEIYAAREDLGSGSVQELQRRCDRAGLTLSLEESDQLDDIFGNHG